MLISIPAAVSDLIASVEVGLIRPDEIVLDTPAGMAYHRRLRGSPRWSGMMTIGETSDPAIGRQVEAFLNQISSGRPNRWRIPADSDATITAATSGTRAADGEWTVDEVAGLAVGSMVTLSNRAFQLVEVGTPAAGKVACRVLPDLPFPPGALAWSPFTGYLAYLSDASPLYHSRRGVGRVGHAIFGGMSVPWSEYVG